MISEAKSHIEEYNQQWKTVLFTFFAFALVLFVYNFPDPSDQIQQARVYFRLAAGFHSGHTYLPNLPSKELSDTFERKDYAKALTMPVTETGEVVWNASLYNGKWYIYYGPTPALICDAWMLFNNGLTCTDALLGKTAAVGMVVFFFLILEKIGMHYSPQSYRKLMWFMCIIFTFGGIQMYMMGGELYTGIYHASILANICFLTAGIYFFLRYILDKNLSYLVPVGICFSLALSSKITAVLYIAPIIAAILIREGLKINKTNYRHFLKVSLMLSPLLLTSVLLLIYNKVRFDNYFEFGIKYVYDEVFVRQAIDSNNLYGMQNIQRNIYIYFLKIPELTRNIPYIKLSVDPTTNTYWTISIFLLAPILLTIGAIFVIPKKIIKPEFRWFFIPLSIGIGINILNYVVWFGTVLRYTYEFVPFLYLFAYIVLLYINERMSSNKFIRGSYSLVLSVTGIWSVFAGYAMLMATTWGNR